MKYRISSLTLLLFASVGWMLAADKLNPPDLLTGENAFTSYKGLQPGEFRKITAASLPAPGKGVANFGRPVPRPADAFPKAPAGFKVELYAEKLDAPREIRTAPNGDFFVAAATKGEIQIFRGITKDGKPEQMSTFATGLNRPFGIVFYPLGKNPQWVYVANTNSVVRFPYKNGDLKASGPSETVIAEIPANGNHFARDLAFSKDGKSLFVSVGSAVNVEDTDTHPNEFHRADILEYTPEGKFVKVYGSGIRNPAGIAVDPNTGELWCSVNERDMLGDNLVPDYITHVQEGGFYGWPWYYTGDHQDPRMPAKPDMKDKVIVPDVLLQPHNASLELTFYEGKMFPKEYKGDIFAAEHGSWNRSVPTGHEVVRIPLKNGKSDGVYEDFLTGFFTPDGKAWGRPVGVAVAPDGSLMVTDDGSNSIWRVVYTGK